MRKVIPVVVIVTVLFAGIYAAKRAQIVSGRHASHQSALVSRVVSLAPSITETIFALGAQAKLVGVTRYCVFPPEATKIAQVGGYLDPSFEAIVRLKPDIVIVTAGNNETRQKLEELGLRVLTVDHNTISGIIDSISRIGQSVGAGKEAERIGADIRRRINAVKSRTIGLKRPTVMISIGRSMGGGIGEIYIAGKDNFYDEIIELAGGTNAYDSRISKTPSVSGEGVTRLNPDIIIELAPDKHKDEAEKSLSQWNRLSQVTAVKNKRVQALTGDYVVIPGPRFVTILEDAARIIHPEVDWSIKQ